MAGQPQGGDERKGPGAQVGGVDEPRPRPADSPHDEHRVDSDVIPDTRGTPAGGRAQQDGGALREEDGNLDKSGTAR